MKEETLEKAAEHNYPSGDVWTEEQAVIRRLAFKNGATWQAKRNELRLKHKKALLDNCEKCLEARIRQAERMYSEDEVRELLMKGLTHTDYNLCGSLVTAQQEIRTANFNVWFEEYKKK